MKQREHQQGPSTSTYLRGLLIAARRLPADERAAVRKSVDDYFYERYNALAGHDARGLALLLDDMRAAAAADADAVRPETLASLQGLLDVRRKKVRLRFMAAAPLAALLYIPAAIVALTILGVWNVGVVAGLLAIAAAGLYGRRWTIKNATWYHPRPSVHRPRVRAAQQRVIAAADALRFASVRPAPTFALAGRARTAPRARQHRSSARRSSGSRSGSDPGDGEPAPPPSSLAAAPLGVSS